MLSEHGRGCYTCVCCERQHNESENPPRAAYGETFCPGCADAQGITRRCHYCGEWRLVEEVKMDHFGNPECVECRDALDAYMAECEFFANRGLVAGA